MEAFNSENEEDMYERAFGRLMIAWADAESELHQVLLAYSGVSPAVGRALFSGKRMKDMTELITIIDYNSPLPLDRSTDLAHVFPQINTINSIRNHIVHYSSGSYAYKDAKTRIVANQRPARYGAVAGYEINTEILAALTHDLYAIANHLNQHHGPRTGPFTPWRENSREDSPTPWLYKQQTPIDKWENPLAGASRSPLQHGSSSKKLQAQRAGGAPKLFVSNESTKT